MKKSAIIGSLLGCAALLGACSTQRAQTTQAPAAQGTEFTNNLAQQYHGFAEQQRLQAWDYGSYNYFERKANVVAQGRALPPEAPGQGWTPRNSEIGRELSAARERLVNALQAGAITRAPAAAARAQARYDCWLESSDDPILATPGPWLTQKYQECRSEFQAAMAEVDAAMRPTPVATPVAPVAPTTPPREQSFLIFFDFDRAEITPQGTAVIQRAVENYRRGTPVRIIATGHADRAGPPDYNQSLSERRAQAVQQALVRSGLPANQITTAGRGETQPLVPTSDGVREAQNRRVEIAIQ